MINWEDFCYEMNEGLNNPVDIKWVDKENELGGFFIVNDRVYNNLYYFVINIIILQINIYKYF